MKIRHIIIPLTIIGSFSILVSLVQENDVSNKENEEVYIAEEKQKVEKVVEQVKVDENQLPVGLSEDHKYIINKESAFILEDNYMKSNGKGTDYNINVFASVLGGSVSDYNGEFYSLVLPDYPTILLKMNSNEFYIYGKKHTTNSDFYFSDNQIFGDFESLAKQTYIEFKKDEKSNILTSFKTREPFDKNSYVTILVFHESNVGENNSMSISPDKLKSQLKALQKSDYSFITDSDLLAYIHDWKDIPDNSIIIHFDDGYESFYKNAFPILKEMNIPSSMYLVGKTVKEKTSDSESYQTPHLSWEQIREMQDTGLVSFQSHTMDMHFKDGVYQQPDEIYEDYVQRIYKDFNDSKQLIEQKLGTPVISVAYPSGAYNDFVDAVAAAYYPMTMTMDHGIEKGNFDPYKIRRIYGNGNDSPSGLIKRINYY